MTCVFLLQNGEWRRLFELVSLQEGRWRKDFTGHVWMENDWSDLLGVTGSLATDDDVGSHPLNASETPACQCQPS